MYFFIYIPILFFRKTNVFDIYKNRLAEAILTNTQNVWFMKGLFKSIRYSCFRRVQIKFLYNSKFDITAKPLVTNSIVITRVLCICFSVQIKPSQKKLLLKYGICSLLLHIISFKVEGCTSVFSRHFYKGDIFCDSLFAYLEDKTLCLWWSKFLPSRVYYIEKGDKNKMA